MNGLRYYTVPDAQFPYPSVTTGAEKNKFFDVLPCRVLSSGFRTVLDVIAKKNLADWSRKQAAAAAVESFVKDPQLSAKIVLQPTLKERVIRGSSRFACQVNSVTRRCV